MNSAYRARLRHAKKNTKLGKAIAKKTKYLRSGRKQG